MPPVSDIVRYPGDMDELRRRLVKWTNYIWTPLGVGSYIVNMDESFLAGSGIGNIGESSGIQKVGPCFNSGKELSVKSAVHTKLLALREGLLVATAS